MEKTEARIISAARRRLDKPEAWLQGWSAARRTPDGSRTLEATGGNTLKDADCWCMTAAMELGAQTTSADRTDVVLNTDGLERAEEIVAACITADETSRVGIDSPPKITDAKTDAQRIAAWQDRPERTHADVVRVLNAALAAA